MQDLIKLDGVSLRSSLDKPRRKTQVRNIQALIDQVDAISTQLQPLHRDLEARVQAQEAQPRAPIQQHQHDQICELILFRVSGLKLFPKFDVTKRRDTLGTLNFILSSSLNGLDWDQCCVQASEDQESLRVTGLCMPSAPELLRMVQNIECYRSRMSQELADSMDDLQVVLHVIAGQYGHFDERFRLPNAAQVSLITSGYEGATLEVTIPTHYGGRQTPVARRQPRSFFGDRDFFWNHDSQ